LFLLNRKTQQKKNRLRALHGFRLLLDGGQHRVLGSGDVAHQPPDVTVARQRELGWVPDVVGQPPPSVARPLLIHHTLVQYSSRSTIEIRIDQYHSPSVITKTKP